MTRNIDHVETRPRSESPLRVDWSDWGECQWTARDLKRAHVDDVRELLDPHSLTNIRRAREALPLVYVDPAQARLH